MVGFTIPDHMAGYCLGVLRGIAGVGPLDSHEGNPLVVIHEGSSSPQAERAIRDLKEVKLPGSSLGVQGVAGPW